MGAIKNLIIKTVFHHDPILFTILNLLPIYLQQNKLPQMICSLTSSFLTVEQVDLYILFLYKNTFPPCYFTSPPNAEYYFSCI